MLTTKLFCPVEVPLRTNDKFEFGELVDALKVFHQERIRRTRVRSFHVQDNFDPWVDISAGLRSTCFQRNLVALVAQDFHQGQSLFLQKWFATSYANIRRTEAIDLFQDFFQALKLALMVGVLGVTVSAAKVAASCANKHSWVSHIGGFALD